MKREYKKIPYVLKGQEPIKHTTSRLQYKKVTKDLEGKFKECIGKIIVGSLDSMDQRLLDNQATIEELVDEYCRWMSSILYIRKIGGRSHIWKIPWLELLSL